MKRPDKRYVTYVPEKSGFKLDYDKREISGFGITSWIISQKPKGSWWQMTIAIITEIILILGISFPVDLAIIILKGAFYVSKLLFSFMLSKTGELVSSLIQVIIKSFVGRILVFTSILVFGYLVYILFSTHLWKEVLESLQRLLYLLF